MPSLAGSSPDYRGAVRDRARPPRGDRAGDPSTPAPATWSSSPARATRPPRRSATAPRPSTTERWRGCSPSSADRHATERPCWSATVIAVMIAGAVATLVSLLGTRFLIAFFRTPRQGASRSSARRTAAPSTTAQAGHADDGRARHRRRRLHRLDRRPHPQRLAFSDQAMIVLGRHPGDGLHGLPRRLHQGPQGSQPRHLLEAEELHHAADRASDRLVAGGDDRHLRDDLVRRAGDPNSRCRPVVVGDLAPG